MRGATFSTRGRIISSPPGESTSHLAEIESRGRKYFPGGRLYKGVISFWVTGFIPFSSVCQPALVIYDEKYLRAFFLTIE